MGKKVREAMSSKPVAVERSQPLLDAARRMRDEDIGSLPLAQADVAQHESGKKTGEVVEAISQR